MLHPSRPIRQDRPNGAPTARSRHLQDAAAALSPHYRDGPNRELRRSPAESPNRVRVRASISTLDSRYNDWKRTNAKVRPGVPPYDRSAITRGALGSAIPTVHSSYGRRPIVPRSAPGLHEHVARRSYRDHLRAKRRRGLQHPRPALDDRDRVPLGHSAECIGGNSCPRHERSSELIRRVAAPSREIDRANHPKAGRPRVPSNPPAGPVVTWSSSPEASRRPTCGRRAGRTGSCSG